jgi:hypothetical protein
MTRFASPRYLFLSLLLFAVSIDSLGFTNIFGVVHRKTEMEVEHMNELLEEEDSTEHLAWYPKRPSRSVKDVSISSVRKEEKKPGKTTPAYASKEEEILERLIELQD